MTSAATQDVMSGFRSPSPFYPIVPDASWVTRLVPLGIHTIQLRIKEASCDDIRRQVRDSLAVCRAHGAELIVNDHWRIAIEEGAPWVHLGQEDVAEADLGAVRTAGVKLGISTHDEVELANALAAAPDYVALGPIFPTTLKAMRFAPQGLARITTWKQSIGGLPLVAIGGLTLETAQGARDSGADSIAVVSDITAHPHPEARVKAWLAWEQAVSRVR